MEIVHDERRTDPDTDTCTRCCKFYEGNTEAVGWAIDVVARGIVTIGAAVFLSTALINLGKEAAGCETEIPEGENEAPECNERVYGIKPTSILVIYSLAVGVGSTAMMPVTGAILDHTSRRLVVGRGSATLIAALVFFEIFVGEKTWFAMAIVHIIVGITYVVHNLVTYAYLPELTEDGDTLIKWTASFSIIQFSSMVLFLGVVIGLATVAGIREDDVATARLSQIIVFVVAVVCFGYPWARLFRERPAFQQVPEHSTILSAGFRKIYNTVRHIHSTNTALTWFLISLSLSEAAFFNLSIIGITYMTDELNFTTTENGIAILILLLSSIPGSASSVYLTRKCGNPIRTLQSCLGLAAINTGLASLFLVRPGQQAVAYAFASVWGICTGMKYPPDRAIYCTIIPKNQDAELMGMYLFAGQVIAWLPPLIFTALNEAGVSMRIGLLSLDLFFVGSLLVLFLVGDYKKAVERAKESEQMEGASSTTEAMEVGIDQGSVEGLDREAFDAPCEHI